MQIGLALYFLWGILGPSSVAGLVVMICILPLNAFIAGKIKNLQMIQMQKKDERVKLMNEILSGIKVNPYPLFVRMMLVPLDENLRLYKFVFFTLVDSFQVLKFYAWETCFEEKVMAIRKLELQVMKESAVWNAMTNVVWQCAPFLVALCTFGAYVLTDSKNVLDANKTFVSLSLFNIMSTPLTFLVSK